MSVDTKAIHGRRKLSFDSFDAVVADAEKLVTSSRTKTLGNWPLPQLLAHLTIAINSSIDGISAKAPWLVRLIGPLIKRRILKRGMSAGFKLPREHEADFFPAVSSPQQALENMRAAVGRLRNEKMTATHPVFGKLTHEEWTLLHLRHAELHLSFAVPE